MNVPPPIASPTPPDPGPEGNSNARLLTEHEYRVRKERWEAQMAEERNADAKMAKLQRLKRTIAAGIALFVTTVGGTISTLAFGQSAIDGGAARAVAPVAKDVAELKASNTKHDEQIQDTAKHLVRVETMLENLSERARIRIPPPVEPRDSGR